MVENFDKFDEWLANQQLHFENSFAILSFMHGQMHKVCKCFACQTFLYAPFIKVFTVKLTLHGNVAAILRHSIASYILMMTLTFS